MSLFAADLRCRIVQSLVYKKAYKGKKVNSFDPWNEPGEKKLENGIVLKNDIAYGSKYPNGFFDLWHPDDSGEKRPVFVYLHGGGMIFGDKSSGDPMAADGNGKVLQDIAKAGYAVVNANYALAPKYRFPVQVEQVDELMRFLIAHAEELRLDMSRVCMSGGSAGADLTEIYSVAVCNPKYAAELGISPIMTRNNLKVLAIDEATLDVRDFDFNKNMYSMLHCWLGDGSREYAGKLALMNAKEHITDCYIPSWINTSNQESWFVDEARELAEKLRSIGCDHDHVYFPPETDTLNHGYMNLKETNGCAKEAFERMMKFIGEHI